VERAIVTPIAGTTRDLIAETATIGGVPVTLLDTAGIAETVDLVEQLGIERSRDALSTAAAVVLVLDGSQPPTNQDLAVARLVAARLPETGMGAVPPALIVINKRDLPERADQSPALDLLPGIPVVELSTRTGEGLDELESGLLAAISGEASANAAPALVTSRQRAALERALNHLREAIAAKESGAPHDLLAIDVRAAMRAIGEVTGESIDESVLTEIFSRFCIGK
jgi:tRNA modification GTPase